MQTVNKEKINIPQPNLSQDSEIKLENLIKIKLMYIYIYYQFHY